MPGEQDYDELVMTLVESALARPRAEREQFLRTVCRANRALYEEVHSRLEWEDRMGKFLCEPLVGRPETQDRPFEPGSRVDDRFVIVREVGRGGMGVVYEAMDEKLDRRIAIKCARPGFRSRLPPEARTAREVSHFNVCKVHDLHVAATPYGEVDFLTMEFVEGETLAERLQHQGPLPEPEARQIAVQVCAGLAQAHRQGVVHGDLKPGNIILARTADGSVRAVLTDFGLARIKLSDGDGSVISARGGTLDYMAPELFHGERSSIASDVYALGVIFHEMLTGRTPRPAGENPGPESTTETKAAVAPTRVATPTDERKIEDLPSTWKRIVTRCIATEPGDRFHSIQEIGDLFEARRSFQYRVPALLIVLAAILVLMIWRWPDPTGPPIRLAVFPITVLGAPIQTASGIGLDVSDRLARIRNRLLVLGPLEVTRNRVTTAEQAKSVLGATHVLKTDLRQDGSEIIVHASLADAGSGQTLRELKASYAAQDTQVLAKALTATVTRAFRLRLGVPAEVVSQAAYPYYLEGIALIHRDSVSADQAIPLFQKALELDQRSALVYAGLGRAQLQKYWQSSDRQWLAAAKASIPKALSLNQDSVPVLLVSGMLKRQEHNDQLAIQDYLRATELEPNNSEVWRNLAIAYEAVNRPDDAIAAYRQAIQAQPDYYRSYLDFGSFYSLRGKYKEAEENYRRATQAAPGLDAGYINLSGVLMLQGRYREAWESIQKALRIAGTSPAYNNLGALYNMEGRDAEALESYKKGMATGHASMYVYHNLGDTYRRLGQTRESIESYRTGQSMVEKELTADPKRAVSRAALGLFSARLGEPRRAEFETAQARSLEPENAKVMRVAALTYEVLGQREKTLAMLRNAPGYLLGELNLHPDLRELQRDTQFMELMTKKANQ